MALDAWEQGDTPTAVAGESHFLEHVGDANPSHLSTASSNYAWMLIEAKRLDEAVQWFQRGLAEAEKLDGHHDEETEYALTGLGAAWVARGRPELAVPLLTRAMTLQHGDETGDDRADAERALAEALWKLGRDRPRALKLARQARDYYASHPMGPRRKSQLAGTEEWLRAHESMLATVVAK